jgi:hypothetical protein
MAAPGIGLHATEWLQKSPVSFAWLRPWRTGRSARGDGGSRVADYSSWQIVIPWGQFSELAEARAAVRLAVPRLRATVIAGKDPSGNFLFVVTVDSEVSQAMLQTSLESAGLRARIVPLRF